MARMYLSTSGDLVSWDALDEAEQAFHTLPRPWEVAEFGLDVREYVRHYWNEVALAEFNGEHPECIPDVP
jgi:hypothetical protein